MKKARTAITWLLVGCLVPFLTGCSGLSDCTLTGRLWEHGDASDRSLPAPHPNLCLYQTANRRDILVIYDETHEDSGVVRRRAYLLNVNKDRIEKGRGPKFVRVRHMDRLLTIPVESAAPSQTNSDAGAGMRAFLLADGRHFTLVSQGAEAGEFYLPAYVSFSGRAGRIALTPLTVSADVVIYGSIAAACAALLLLAAQANSND
jgi:hypothetical protein